MNNRQIISKAVSLIESERKKYEERYREYLRIGAFLRKHHFNIEADVLRKQMDELDDIKVSLLILEDKIKDLAK